jgi:hypothetical protein
MVRPAASPTTRPASPPVGSSSSGSSAAKDGAKDKPSVTDANPLAAPAGMAARREFNGAPLRTSDAYDAYKNMTADSFAGPDDIRLRQLNRAATAENVGLVRRLDQAVQGAGVEADVYGRAKTPFSTFGKLREADGVRIDDIKDLSGARVDITPRAPGFQEYYRAQDAAQGAIPELQLKKDYIQKPNPWGYTGRIHHTAEAASGMTHEVQVGSKDLSQFIDKKVTTAGGDKIGVHDATGYKGQIYGARVPPHLEGRYTELMGRITEANKAGKAVADVPELQRDLNQFYKAVEEALPAKLNGPPAPELSRTAKAGNIAGKGLGVLGVAGGGLQVANGVSTIANGGDKVEGGADIVAGGGSMVSGGAMIAGRMALGTTTGGAVAVVDGAKDIYTGIRDGNVEKAAVGTVKSGAGAAMIAGVATANPILIAGGAIAYGGAVIYDNREAIGNAGKKAWGWVKSWF